MTTPPGSSRAATRPRTTVRPTARGLLLTLLGAALLWGSAIVGLEAMRLLGVALLLLVVLAAVTLALSCMGLDARRQLSATEAIVGDALTERIALTERALLARIPLARVQVDVVHPPALGGAAERRLHQPAPLPVLRRGTHPLGAVRLAVRDPFSLAQLRRTVPAPATVVGLPALEGIPAHLLHALGWSQSDAGQVASRTSTDAGPIPRPYAHGDDVRRIHWRASARGHGLMVREDEAARARTALLQLDTRSADASHADRAVEVAGSLAVALHLRGWNVRLVDASGADRALLKAGAPTAERTLQRLLADLTFNAPREALAAPVIRGADPAVAVLISPDLTSAAVTTLPRSAGQRLVLEITDRETPASRHLADWAHLEIPAHNHKNLTAAIELLAQRSTRSAHAGGGAA